MAKTQVQKFKAMAKAVEANDDERNFNAALKRIGLATVAKAKPKKKRKKAS